MRKIYHSGKTHSRAVGRVCENPIWRKPRLALLLGYGEEPTQGNPTSQGIPKLMTIIIMLIK
jgi:hypothetical protein